ncbi:MAG: NAD-dependent epimerase/dehydratase family protein [Candidatus Methylomirabilales bacterium]
MRIGLVGCGQIARVHIPFILRDKRHTIVGVCDQDVAKADVLTQRFKISKTYGNFAQLLEEQRPDVVHVLTPPQSHAALALQAMEAGCHVLVEKPMALSVQEADRMIDAAKAHGVKLCVNHNQLFDPVFLEARRLIEKGAVGTVIGVESYYGFNLGQTSERRWVENLPSGLFQDLAPHPLSLILEFLQDPLDLYASTLVTGMLGPHVPDELRVLMTGKDAVGTLSISLGIRPHLNFLKIYGSKSILNVDLANMILSRERLTPLPKAMARGLMSVEQGAQLATGAVRNAVKFVLGRLKPYQGLENLVQAFYESIEHGQDPPIPGETGRRVVQVFEAIQRKLPKPMIRQRHSNRDRGKRSRVFVTGASGFLGSHLVENLSKDGTVIRALVRPTSRIGHLRSLDVELVEGDLGDVEKLKKGMEHCEVVYHCAAATKGTWSDYLESTIRGTERLLEASVAVGVRRFVHISSLSVYGVHPLKDNEWVTEDTPYELHPEKRGYYTHSKVEAEKLVLRYAQNQGLQTTILRPGTIYGPRGRVFFPQAGYSLKNKIFLIIGRGDHLLPLAYVENVVDAICLAGVREEAVGQICNIVDDEQITGREYLNELIQRTGLKAFTLHVPFGFIYVAASLLELRANMLRTKNLPALSRYRLVCATKNLRYDTSRAKNRLQWKPDVSIEQGLRRTFDSYRHAQKRH